MKHKNVRKVGYGPAAMAIGAVVSAAMSVVSYMEQSSAADDAAAAQERQAEMQKRINERNAQKQRIAASREERMRRADVLSNVSTAGVVAGGTSPVMGSISSLGSQFGSNISNINTNLGASNAMGDAMTDYYNAVGNMQGWQQIGSAAGSIFNATGGFNALKNFGTPTPTPTA
jgi:hypothetical protein